jgi:glucose-1-phosphate thymidylyltransferase
MKCVILCAGYATRLYPVTLEYPKHLLKINGKPIVQHIYEKLKNVPEMDEIILVTNNKFYPLFKNWIDKTNAKITLINDYTNCSEEKLGGIGDLYFAIEKLNIEEDLLIICGDNFFEFDLKSFVDLSKTKNSVSIALYDVEDLNKAKLFGVVKVKNNLLKNFQEKPENPDSTLISTGIYFFPKTKIKEIGNYIRVNENKEGVGYLIKHLYQNTNVYVHIFKEPWYDVGTVEQYKSLQEKYSK